MQNNRKKSPLFQKASEILKLVNAFALTLPEDELFQTMVSIYIVDAQMIMVKISGAEAVDLYDIKMQNAAFIRYHAMSLKTGIGGFRMFESVTNHDFIEIIRKEVDEFRLLFIDWIFNFDTSEYCWDEWELFNPKGAVPPQNEYL